MNIGSIGSSFSFNAIGSMPRMQGTSPAPAEFAANIMEQEDKNQDGVISADESRVDSKRFSELDTDSDGKLTTDELVASFKNHPLPPPRFGGKMDVADFAAHVMETEDTNGDGTISADETRLGSERFAAWDTDSSGTLTSEELQAGMKADEAERSNEKSLLTQGNSLNTNTDGTLLQSLFEALSKNDASNAYSGQNWLVSLLQSSQQLSLNA